MRFPKCNRYWLLAFFLLENFLFSGVLYGWEEFIELLRKNDVFAHQCKIENENERTCLVQDSMFFMLYTVCILAKSLSGVFTLQLLKRVSLKYVRMVPLFVIISGGMLMTFTIETYPRMVYTGAVLISIAGGQVLFCSFSIAGLFPSRRCTVISLCCGAFCASHVVFHLFQVIEDTFSITYRQIFTAWSACALIMLLPNIFLLKELQPSVTNYASNVARMLVAKTKRDSNKKYQLLEDSHVSDESDSEKNIGTAALQPNFVENDVQTKGEIEDSFEGWRTNTVQASIPFFLHVWWVSVLSLVLLNYKTDFYSWMEERFEETHNREDWKYQKVMLIKSAWTYSPFAMFLIAPISGLLLDCSANKVNKETDLEKLKAKRMRSGACVLLMTTLLVMALLILKIFNYFTLTNVVLYAVAYATLNSVAISYMSIRFPWEVFRNVVSVLWLVTSTFGMLEFPLKTLMVAFPIWPSIILIVLVGTALVSVLPFVQIVLRPFDTVSSISS